MKIFLPDKAVRLIDCRPLPVDRLLEELGLNTVEVIVSRNGKLVPGDAMVGEDDEIRILRIAHGG